MEMKKGACIRKFQISINTNLAMVILMVIALTLSVNHLTICFVRLLKGFELSSNLYESIYCKI